jgi:hypothetical protein
VSQPLNHKERRRLEFLERRAALLEERISKAAEQGRNFSFDKEEAGALRWAVERILSQPPQPSQRKGE